MTEQERINENIQRQIDAQNARVDTVLAKVDTIIGEMRDRDNQRAEEIREIRQDMKEMQNRFYTKMDNLDAKIDGIGNHVRNLAITSMAAVGGMFVAVGAMVATVIYSILKS